MLDKLDIGSHIGEVTKHSFRVFHQLNKGDKILALAETGLIAFNYAERKIAPIPASFRQALENRQEVGLL